MHGKFAHVGIRIVGEKFTFDDVRVLNDLRNIVDRPDGDFGLLEKRDVLRLRALGDERTDDGVELSGVLHALSVGLVPRVVD